MSLPEEDSVLSPDQRPKTAAWCTYDLTEKQESGRQTLVLLPDAEERTGQIAHMISGAKLTDTSPKHAGQMLKANR